MELTAQEASWGHGQARHLPPQKPGWDPSPPADRLRCPPMTSPPQKEQLRWVLFVSETQRQTDPGSRLPPHRRALIQSYKCAGAEAVENLMTNIHLCGQTKLCMNGAHGCSLPAIMTSR